MNDYTFLCSGLLWEHGKGKIDFYDKNGPAFLNPRWKRVFKPNFLVKF